MKRLHLKLGIKAREKLLKRLKPLGKAAACAEGGYLEPFVLLEPPAHNPGCSCVYWDVCLILSLEPLPRTPWTLSWTPLDPLDPPTPPFLDPLKPPYTQTLNPSVWCLFFMPDPRFMRQQGQRSWLRAFMLWTSLPLNPLDSHAPGPCLNPS